MDNIRVFLFLGLAMVLLLLYQAWMRDYGPQPGAAAVATTATGQPAVPAGVTPDGIPSSLPSVRAGSGTTTGGEVPGQERSQPGARVRVVTDLLDVDLSLLGGDLRRADLPTYPVTLEQPDVPFRLLDDSAALFHVAQSGLLAGSGTTVPNHRSEFTAEQLEYRLADGADQLVVPLRWRGDDGLEVEKRYLFRRDSFVVEVQFVVRNGSGATHEVSQYRQLQRTPPTDESRLLYTYTGGVIYSPEEKYEKIDFDDMASAPLSRDITHGWAAMIQHYFLTAWLPAPDETNRYETRALDGGRYLLRLISPAQQLAPGGEATLASRLYLGPKEQARLKRLAEGLELTVDYGMLTVIAQPIYWLLDKIHGVLGNWGWTIIALTVLIKLAFYKLSETSYRSMANMRRMQPRLTALRERYGDDKQRLQQAMMEIYKKEKINPLGGCLPILVQIPVFIALYWVLLESVELRQAPWILWLDDLSRKDPYFVLPILMGASMFVQQKLNPAPPDPMQAKIMMALPFVFTIMFMFFPSGLVLYWVVNNLLSISQQWVITRRIEAGAKA
ncbi:MAG TPA: membrane protein insertase YidC [Gammaproteobacteria bacterium]